MKCVFARATPLRPAIATVVFCAFSAGASRTAYRVAAAGEGVLLGVALADGEAIEETLDAEGDA
jgi:hypothetical protein